MRDYSKLTLFIVVIVVFMVVAGRSYLTFQPKTVTNELFILETSSNGEIRLLKNVDKFPNRNQPYEDKTIIAVVFKDQDGNEKVMEYLNLPSNTYGRAQLVGDDVFFLDSTRKVGLINLVSKDKKMFDLSVKAQKFFVYGNNLFYLAYTDRTEHNGYRYDLHQYNLISNQDYILASEFISEEIMGYDPVSNKLYMVYSTGSDVASMVVIEAYDFANKVFTEVANYFGRDWPPKDGKIKEIETLLKDQMRYIEYISIENGKVADVQPVQTLKYQNASIRYTGR